MIRLLRACYDWRVITVVTAVGLGVYLAAPRLVATVLPLLVLGICPLSMLVMMRSMGRDEAADPTAEAALETAKVDRAALRRELDAIARQQARLTAALEAFDDRDRGQTSSDRNSLHGQSSAMRPQPRPRQSP